MAFTTSTAQADAIGPAGSIVVRIERHDEDNKATLDPLVRVYTNRDDEHESEGGGRWLTLPAALVGVFLDALTLAVAEARRTEIIPRAEG